MVRRKFWHGFVESQPSVWRVMGSQYEEIANESGQAVGGQDSLCDDDEKKVIVLGCISKQLGWLVRLIANIMTGIVP